MNLQISGRFWSLAIRFYCAVLIVLSAEIQACFSQNFTNLDFESATFVPISGDPFGRDQFAQAFPGWTVTVGGLPVSGTLSNNIFLDTAGTSIINSNYNVSGFIPGGRIEGKYTAILMSGTLTNTQTGVDTSLYQTGLVPIGTQSLQFKAYEAFDSSGAFAVTLGGQTLSLSVLGSGTNYTLYGADINSFAGQPEQLNFTVFGENPHVNDEYLYLDSIQFSTQAVPEPGDLALLSMGIFFLGIRSWRRIRLF
jgi:hypothetical protein